MNDFNSIETTHNFYTELINRFFHPRSYFFVCVQKFLKNHSLIINDGDESLSPILSQLVRHLIKSKHPAQELKEITQINGFENLYSNLQHQLVQLNLRSLDQPQLKIAIRHTALSFLKEIYQVLSTNKKGQRVLVRYLKIKTQLRELLNGSNGRHTPQNSTVSQEKKLATEASDSPPKDEVSQNHAELKLPPEDDEELLKFIQDINVPEIALSDSNSSDNTLIEKVETDTTPIKETVQEQPQEAYDLSITKSFQQEAELYYKILLKAISQLKSEEKIQSALEDIELVSSSLKHLAQKFGLEKIALLPELIESISVIANQQIIKLSPAILQNIEEGILLVKEFNQNNTDYKAKFMSILSSLKEYHSRTVNTTKEISIAS